MVEICIEIKIDVLHESLCNHIAYFANVLRCCVCGILICELLGVWGICSWFFKVFSPLICTCEFDIKSTMHELACHKQPLLEIPKLFNAFQQQIFLNFNINNKFQQHVEVHNWMLIGENFDIWFNHEHHVCCCLCTKPLLLIPSLLMIIVFSLHNNHLVISLFIFLFRFSLPHFHLDFNVSNYWASCFIGGDNVFFTFLLNHVGMSFSSNQQRRHTNELSFEVLELVEFKWLLFLSFKLIITL